LGYFVEKTSYILSAPILSLNFYILSGNQLQKQFFLFFEF